MTNPLIDLLRTGQSFWLDNIRREWLDEGTLADMVENRGLRGLTSNPAIFFKAITTSTAYDKQIAELAHAGAGVTEIYESLVVSDIKRAADVLRPVWESSDGADGYVSLEVSPFLAHDAAGSVAEARRLFAAVERPNVMIKIPGTPEGLPAIEALIADGIPVNVTLLFSTAQYEAAAEAYIRGLETRSARGESLEVASVASVFLSRIDSHVDGLLSNRLTPCERTAVVDTDAGALFGKIALASARMTYAAFESHFKGDRFAELDANGARPQRVLWASTSTKNPFYSDVMYVEPLVGTETVNTMPDGTANAFEDHGIIAEQAVSSGMKEASRELEALGRLGINLDQVCQHLQDEGVVKFTAPFGKLMKALAAKRSAVLEDRTVSVDVRPGAVTAAWKKQLAALETFRAVERVWAHDATLWCHDDPSVKAIANRLGWVDLPRDMPAEIADIVAFADAVRSDFDTVVLLGMGGSSLTSDVAASVFGSREGYPDLEVLDTTHPDAVSAATARLDLQRTLFLVASKSGGTVETMSLFHHFYQQLSELVGSDAGSHFVAITDGGSPLVGAAEERGFRKVFINPGDIGGRYSALSWFGLVPMALAGYDIAAIVDRAGEMAECVGPHLRPPDNPAAQLGMLMSASYASGRCALNLVTSERLTLVADWLEQLIAESTGKRGRGVLPVTREPLGDVVRGYGVGRAFVFLHLRDEPRPAAYDVLVEAGHPVADITLPSPTDIGQIFYLWEHATALCAVGLNINPFDEPDVRSAKMATGRILEEGQQLALETLAEGGNATVYGDPETSRRDAAGSVAGVVAKFLSDAGEDHEYVAITAFLNDTDAVREALFSFRGAIRKVAPELATTLGIGPRYLHSIGQLYKGGHNCGLHIQLVDEPSTDVPIPGASYDFETLISAQAQGDFQALLDKERRSLRIVLHGDASVDIGRIADELVG